MPDNHSETAIVKSKEDKRSPMLDITLIGQLRVVGSMSPEAHPSLQPGKTVIGRNGADIVVDDVALSAHHFEIENRDRTFFISDLDSTNGTKVNGETVDETRPLRSGDRIEAGKTVFLFRTLEAIPWNRND